VGIRRVVRVCLVSNRACGMATVLQRLLVPDADLRVDVDRLGWLVVADTPLRAMGVRPQLLVVLDSGPDVGTGLGLMGVGARVCELVPAWLRRSASVRTAGWCDELVARVGRRPAHLFRSHRPLSEPLRDCASSHSADHNIFGALRGSSGSTKLLTRNEHDRQLQRRCATACSTKTFDRSARHAGRCTTTT
jgi:hypothetical protein